jgi:hypothetical protein
MPLIRALLVALALSLCAAPAALAVDNCPPACGPDPEPDPEPTPPTAQLSAPNSATRTVGTVTFDASQSSGGSDGFGVPKAITKFEWDLDGQPGFESDTGTTATKTVAFLQGFPLGQLNARVRVTSATGTATKTHAITILNRAPSASLTVDDETPVTGQQVTFTGTSSDEDSIGGSLNIWKFNDVWCSVVSTTCPWDVYQRVYTTPGTYTQWFGGEDAENGRTEVSKTVTVRAAPVANLAAPQSAIIGEQVELDASGSTGSGPLTYRWDVDGNAGNGYEVDGGTNPKRKITLPAGTRQVRVKITDNGGASAESTAKSIFAHANPVANFTYAPAEPVVGETITLTSQASDDRGIVAHMWDLDGDEANGFEWGFQEATVTFETPGPHVVRYKVNDMDGGTAVVTKTITVRSKDEPKDPGKEPERPGDDSKAPPKGGDGGNGGAPAPAAGPSPAAAGPIASVVTGAPRVAAPVRKAAPKRCKVAKAKKAKKGKKARAAAKRKKTKKRASATCAKPKKKKAARKRRK